MKIIVNRKQLFEAASVVAKASSGRSATTLPELSGILVETDIDNQLLKLTATNLEMMVQRRIKDIRIEGEGSAVIVAGLFCNMIDLLDGEFVTFETFDNQRISVNSGNAIYTIHGLKPECFPKPEIPFPEDTIKITGLPALLNSTMFATADENSNRTEFQGVKISFGKDCTTATATDISRLAFAEAEHCADGSLDVLIHKRSLNVLRNIIKRTDELYVGVAAKSFVVLKPDMIFSARLLEGKFVDAGKMMGLLKKSYSAVVNTGSFLEGFANVNACAKSVSGSLVNLKVINQGIRLSVRNEIGTADTAIVASDTIPTPEDGFYYRPEVILDFLKVTTGELEIVIDDRGFMLIKSSGCKYLVSPMKKPEEKKKETPKKKLKEENIQKSKTKKSTTPKAA